jgi:hypothetical protein
MIDLRPRDSGSSAGRLGGSARENDGRFELRGVAPGQYVLTAALFADNIFHSARTPIDVGAANVDDLELALVPGGELKGVLRVDGGAPLRMSGVRILLQPRGEVSFGGGMEGVKEDGSFTLRNVSLDEFTIGVTGLPENFYVKSVRLGETDITHRTLDLSHGSGAGLELVVSPKAASFEGTVAGDDGKPSPGSQVVLVPEGELRRQASLFRTATSDAQGAFSLRGIPPGEYRAFAFQDVETGAWFDPEFLAPLEGAAEKVTLGESAVVTRPLKALR